MKNYYSPASLKFFIFPAFSFLFFGASVLPLEAQTNHQREIAVITDQSGNRRVVRYSDLFVQMALEPTPPPDSLRREDLKRALQSIIDLALISLELESVAAFCSSQAVTKDEIEWKAQRFPSLEEFAKRLRMFGFQSMNDLNYEQFVDSLTSFNKYLNLRFRSFIIIPAEEEEKYYRQVFAPDFRRKNPGLILPDFQSTRAQIRKILIEQQAASGIKRFLENARRRVKTEILSEEFK